jgi:capsid portal protein
MVTVKKKYGKKPIASTAGSDIAESLKADPALTAFSFDGPYPVRDMADLLDNLYCMDNGRYYETPVDFYGLAKAPRQSAWHESALYFQTQCADRLLYPAQAAQSPDLFRVCAGLVHVWQCLS